MIRNVRSVVMLLALGACGPDEVVQTPDRIEEPEPERPVGESRLDNFLYDDEGKLRESDVVIAGLTMPRGLELEREEERRHIYTTQVPRPKLLEYFGPRLFTGAVDPIGDGAIYRAATVQGVRGGSVKLDVTVIRTGVNTRVEVFELPPIPENMPSPAELHRLYQEELRRAE